MKHTTEKVNVIPTKLQSKYDMHKWHACLAIEKAFQISALGSDGDAVDWGAMGRAAYHVGAARAISDVMYDR